MNTCEDCGSPIDEDGAWLCAACETKRRADHEDEEAHS